MYTPNFFDYVYGKMIYRLSNFFDWPFYAMIQACMRRADDQNLRMMKGCWPEVYEDLKKRYNAPGGMLGDEKLNKKRYLELMRTVDAVGDKMIGGAK